MEVNSGGLDRNRKNRSAQLGLSSAHGVLREPGLRGFPARARPVSLLPNLLLLLSGRPRTFRRSCSCPQGRARHPAEGRPLIHGPSVKSDRLRTKFSKGPHLGESQPPGRAVSRYCLPASLPSATWSSRCSRRPSSLPTWHVMLLGPGTPTLHRSLPTPHRL